MKIILFVIIALISLSSQTETDSHSAAVDYNNIPGTQIYLFDKSNAFSYISIDSTVTNKMKATMYLYLTTQLSSISNGVYTSIGFGTTRMSGSDILLCAVTKSANAWCKDYYGTRDNIYAATSVTSLVKSSVNSLGAAWYPYVVQVIWEVERSMNPTSYINGSGQASYAYGTLNSAGQPQEHPRGYFDGIVTGDGNTGNPPKVIADTTSNTTTSTTTGSTGSTTGSNPSNTNAGSTSTNTDAPTTTDTNTGTTSTSTNSTTTAKDTYTGTTSTNTNATTTETNTNTGSTSTNTKATTTATNTNTGSTSTSTNDTTTTTDTNTGSASTDTKAATTTDTTNTNTTTTTTSTTIAPATTNLKSTTSSIAIVVSNFLLLLYLII